MANEGRTSNRLRVDRDRYDVQRLDPINRGWSSPFAAMRRMQDELERWFGSPGAPRSWMPSADEQQLDWAPAVDVFQRGTDLVVRADLPGMSKKDIEVEVNDDSLGARTP